MIVPWHMWGSMANITLAPSSRPTTAQLARVEYKRPESWRFLFYARILRSNLSAVGSVLVTFNVSTGVGRASMFIKNFEIYEFDIGLTGEQGASNPKYSTTALGPVRNDSLGPAQADNLIETIVGQDIQIEYNAVLPSGGLAPNDQVQLEIGVALSPWHHARPDWQIHSYLGEELRGK